MRQCEGGRMMGEEDRENMGPINTHLSRQTKHDESKQQRGLTGTDR